MIVRIFAVAAISSLLVFSQLLPKTRINLPIYKIFPQKIDAGVDSIKNSPPVQKLSYSQLQEYTANSIVVIDAKTGTSLYEKTPHLKHFPASIAKLMTALVALEKCALQDVLTVNIIEKQGTQMGLQVGDKVTVENLLYGLLINSGNDSALVLANACSDSQEQFVKKMNEKAQNLGMSSSHFMNPTGFDNNYQYSTAADLAKLANVAISNPLLAKIVLTKSTVVTDVSATRAYYLQNINELLGEVDGLEGIKTGQTEGAHQNLVSKTTRNGNSIITVVLGSKNRFDESKKLIEWAFDNFSWANSQ